MFVFKNKDKFTIHNIPHAYETRGTNINYPVHRLTITEINPHYMCIKLYNKLNEKLKKIEKIHKFKKEIKNLLINLEPYNLEDYIAS